MLLRDQTRSFPILTSNSLKHKAVVHPVTCKTLIRGIRGHFESRFHKKRLF
jgi:hypothetical protein